MYGIKIQIRRIYIPDWTVDWLDKNLRRKLQISYGGYALIPGTRQYGFSETAVLEFLNGKQARNPEITKLKLWFEREVFFTLRRKREGV